MATYSTSLQIKLITDGTESGVWGSSTNTNWNLMEQAVAGVQSIVMINADYTLSVANGASDEARNAVLVVTGTNSAIRKIVAPLVPKVYMVYNNTTGGYAITIGGSTGTVATIPTATTCFVYCDGTNFYSGTSGSPGNFTVAGNETVAGTLSVTGTSSFTGSAAFSGTPTAPTASAGTNTTQIATTAFVGTAITNLSLGTMSTQNANNVSITGGTISGLGTALPVASGGTGSSSLTANNVILGNGTSAVQVVAPGTSGNVLKSNGTTWVSGAGFTWNTTYVDVDVLDGGSYSLPSNCIGIYVWCTVSGSGNNGGIGRAQIKNGGGTVIGTAYINGTNIGGGADGGSGMNDGAGSFIPMSSSATTVAFDVFNNARGGTFKVQAYVTSA